MDTVDPGTDRKNTVKLPPIQRDKRVTGSDKIIKEEPAQAAATEVLGSSLIAPKAAGEGQPSNAAGGAAGGEDEVNEENIMNAQIDFNDFLREEEDKGLDYKIVYRDTTINELPKFMIHHNDPRRLNWDLAIIFLAVYNCITIPLNLTFAQGQDSHVGFYILERVIDVFFILDIALNFRTTYVNPTKNIEITNAKRIAKNYINSVRFPIDILASIPFEVFALGTEKQAAENDEEGSFEL